MNQQVTIDGVEFVAIRTEGTCLTANVKCWFLELKEVDPTTRCPRNRDDLLRCTRPTYEVIFMKPEAFLKARMKGDV